MPIDVGPDRVAVVRLQNDPQFTKELDSLAHAELPKPPAVMLDFSGVRYLNSSNLARLLRLRKTLIEQNGKLALCALNAQVMSVFVVTALDKIFNIAPTFDEAMRVARGQSN